MSHPYVDKFKTLSREFSTYLARTFLQDGKTGYAKLALTSVLALWGLHYFARSYGLLPKKSVKDVHIFITGAGNGIGRQMAIKFARLGAKVSIADIDLKSAEAVEGTIKQEGLQAKAIFCDVTKVQSVKEAAIIARETFGDVEILINNAGVLFGKKIPDMTDTMIDKTFQVNTVSHAYTVREFLPEMLKKNKGHIVTIASVGGTIGVYSLSSYCASKFAVFGFNESLRMELRHLKSNVKTTCICPYYIDTGMAEGVKSRMPLFFPILKESYASDRIVQAVLQEEKVTVFPFSCNLTFLFRALLPVSLFDAAADFTGSNSSMDTFVGRKDQQQI